MRRRRLLQLVLSVIAALPARVRLVAQAPSLSANDEARIRAIAEVVLPTEIGAERRAAVVDGFFRWLHEYRADAAMDHGYGFTRLRRTPPSPVAKYRAQLDALEPAPGKESIEAAIAGARIERLPARPDGGHIATDLMAFYFNSVEANDLGYRAAIGRDTCRSLEGSENRPTPLGDR